MKGTSWLCSNARKCHFPISYITERCKMIVSITFSVNETRRMYRFSLKGVSVGKQTDVSSKKYVNLLVNICVKCVMPCRMWPGITCGLEAGIFPLWADHGLPLTSHPHSVRLCFSVWAAPECRGSSATSLKELYSKQMARCAQRQRGPSHGISYGLFFPGEALPGSSLPSAVLCSKYCVNKWLSPMTSPWCWHNLSHSMSTCSQC